MTDGQDGHNREYHIVAPDNTDIRTQRTACTFAGR